MTHEKELFGITITSKMAHDTMKAIFDLVWRQNEKQSPQKKVTKKKTEKKNPENKQIDNKTQQSLRSD